MKRIKYKKLRSGVPVFLNDTAYPALYADMLGNGRVLKEDF